MTLNRKMTDIAVATSLSFALITGDVAAIAEPPQMEDPDAHERGGVGGNFEYLRHHERYDERRCYRGEYDEYGVTAHLHYAYEVHAEPEKDYACLQYLLRRELDAAFEQFGTAEERYHHAEHDGEHRASDHGNELAEEPRGTASTAHSATPGTVALSQSHIFA